MPPWCNADREEVGTLSEDLSYNRLYPRMKILLMVARQASNH